jgi:spore maturation protein CgeB
LNKSLQQRESDDLTVMIVGDYAWPWYQEACARAIERNGYKVYRFSWFDDFKYWREGSVEPFYKSFFHRLQYRFQIGPNVYKISKRLVNQSKILKPDIIWFYNVHLLGNSTLKKLRKALPKTKFVQYSNDDPFSKKGTLFLWRKFLSSIRLFDIHFVYRNKNKEDLKLYGIDESFLLRAYFIAEEDYQIPIDEIPKEFLCDVVFAGHYEDDGRIEFLESICQAGYKLNLFGGGWNRALNRLEKDSPLTKLFPIEPATGDNYRHAISGAKVALCFLSTLNHDTYTRRNFQIPAMKTAMLSQYTEDLANLYEEGKEVMLFKDKEDMLYKLELLIKDQDLRRSISQSGYQRVYEDGHEVASRMESFLDIIKKKKKEKL